MPGPTDPFKTRSLRTRRRRKTEPRDVTEAEYLRVRERFLFGSLGPASPVKRIISKGECDPVQTREEAMADFKKQWLTE
jgi:hypothetical protein